jgi:regulatory protein
VNEDDVHIVRVDLDAESRTLRVVLSDGAIAEVAPDAPEVRGLSAGQLLDARQRGALQAAAARKAAARAALRLLARRRYSRARLRERLLRAGADEAPTDAVLEQLAAQGLLDDRDFARAFAADQLARRPVGRAWLLARLRSQGVAREDARAGVGEVVPAERELELARQALAARRRVPARAASAVAEMRFLVARGFPPTVARQAVQASGLERAAPAQRAAAAGAAPRAGAPRRNRRRSEGGS